MYRLALTFFAVSLFPASASAQSLNCENPKTQIDMNACAFKDYQSADAELNAIYKQARNRLSEAGRIALRDAQRAWIKFRDNDCEAAGSQYQGGSIRPLVVNNCLERLTRERTAGLRFLLENR